MVDITSLDEKSKKLIDDIILLNKKGLEFLQKSDEIDYEKKINESGINFISSNEIIFIHRSLGFSKNALVRPQLLESAVQRPINIFLYKDETSITSLASELCFGLTQNHPFIDGNKRVALVSTHYFLEINHIPGPKDTLGFADYIIKLAQHTITPEDLNIFLDQKIQLNLPQNM